MRILIRILIVIVLFAGVGAGTIPPIQKFLEERRKPNFEFGEVELGTIREIVEATGEIKPTLSVSIGSFVSGPVIELMVDFNDRVKKGDVLAKIDPRIYDATVARDKASLATRVAEVERVKAQLQKAINDQNRALQMFQDNEYFVSQAELDQHKYGRLSLDAQLVVANAGVEQAKANLDNSLANQAYTIITAPEDGIVIDRKIDPGQTLASAFQTPELFTIAVDMDREMHVYASIDESEIGQIKIASAAGKTVKFQVDAYPDEMFEGKIAQIRLSSMELQNVVTYPVVVSAPNPELKLLPGMTANLTFLIDEKKDVLKIPGSAIRFYPKREWVQEEYRDILDGANEQSINKDSDEGSDDDENEDDDFLIAETTEDLIKLREKKNRRHVWIQDGDLLKAVEIIIGSADNKFFEVVSGELKQGQKVVTRETKF